MKPSVRASSVEGLRSELKDLRRQVQDLHRQQPWPFDPPESSGGLVAVIDAGDAQVITGYTKRFFIDRARTLQTVTGVLEVAGTTDTTAQVIHNGFALTNLVIPAGATVVTVGVGVAFDAGDFLQMQQTVAGSGAVGPTYYGAFS